MMRPNKIDESNYDTHKQIFETDDKINDYKTLNPYYLTQNPRILLQENEV